ncbi:MAG TPA: HEAT repeat domain-containing protein [Gemmataceae bacterium]|jgi:hypothetical protein|nr:HEAT repeat domain-containing protein [Gemmataceae bacterium]
MTSRKRWLLGCSLLVLAALIVASFLEPYQIVPGLLHGDAFYQMRPTRYWQEILRNDGRAGKISKETEGRFWHRSNSVPVLQQCLRAPDKNVRWPAAYFLARMDYDRKIIASLCECLHDDDPEVRFQAIGGMLRIQGKSPPPAAVQEMMTVMKSDPELQIRHAAERVLWRIDPAAAREARGWLHFVSKEWGFSAEVPAPPKMLEQIVQSPGGPVPAHAFQFWMEPSCFQIIVNEYPKDFVESTTEEQRNDGLRKAVPFFFIGGKITSEKEIEFQGRKGTELYVEVPDMGDIQQRHFWVGNRMYVVTLIFQKKFVIPEAAKYFLESFRIETTP